MSNSDGGRIEAIWVKRVKRVPVEPVSEAKLVAGHGLEGNVRQGPGRQVTLIESEIWDGLVERFGEDLSPAARRANILVRGLHLANTTGRILRIGASRILITGETKPCSRMEEAMPGLQEALGPDWGGGACGQVLDGGQIAVGDTVEWEIVAEPAVTNAGGD